MMRLRMAIVPVVAAAVAACGSGDAEGDGSNGRSATTAKEQDRSGYFDSTQSEALNPAIATYNEASAKYSTGLAGCERQAERLFEAGRPPREAARCHVTRTRAVLGAVTRLRTQVQGLEGDWREPCEEALTGLEASVASLEKGWRQVAADWQSYAKSGELAGAKLQEHVDAAGAAATTFAEDALPELTSACYTDEDRDAG